MSAANPTSVIIYTRVSTDEQVSGYSLKHQEERLRQYCAQNQLEVARHYQDDASAKSFNRPAFKLLLNYLERNPGKIKKLLILRFDRFSRNLTESFRMLSVLRGLGVELIAIEQAIDDSVPENLLLQAIYLTIPQVENERRSLGIRAGVRRAKREGRWLGPAPRGYKNERDETRKPLIIPGAEATFVRKAFELYSTGEYSIEELRKQLRSEGFRMSSSNFHRLLSNHVYSGTIRINAWRDEPEEFVEGLHEGLVAKDLFNKVQILLQEKSRRVRPVKHRDSVFLLRGYLKCAACGRNLTGSRSKGNGGYFSYYHCQHPCKYRVRAVEANERFRAYVNSLKLSPSDASMLQEFFIAFNRHSIQNHQIKLSDLGATLGLTEKRLLKVEERFLEDELSRESYDRLRRNYQDRADLLRKEISDLKELSSGFLDQVTFVIGLFSAIDRVFNESPVDVQRRMIGSLALGGVVLEGKQYRTLNAETITSTMTTIIKGIRRSGSKKLAPKAQISRMVEQNGLVSNLFISQIRRVFEELHPFIPLP